MGACYSCCSYYYNIHKLKKASYENGLFTLEGKQMFGKIVDIYDCDTFTIAFYLDRKIKLYKCRLYGIDGAELQGDTKQIALDAKQHVIETLIGNKLSQPIIKYSKKELRELYKDNIVFVKCFPFEKYGRLLVEVYICKKLCGMYVEEGVSINKNLILNGFAKEYFGKTKEKWLEK
jgi:endonuclease YncB( thermonuclease family)